MLFQNKIYQYLTEIRELENFFREAQSKEILPLSFFSSSIDIINRLRLGIYEIEASQLKVMEEHLKRHDNNRYEISELKEPGKPKELIEFREPTKFKELKIVEEEKINPVINTLADTISRKINANFGKSLSLNDRIMFQRDLFRGNSDEMNQVFAQINTFQSLNEVLEFLNDKYIIPWSSDSGIAFKELLDKRFA